MTGQGRVPARPAEAWLEHRLAWKHPRDTCGKNAQQRGGAQAVRLLGTTRVSRGRAVAMARAALAAGWGLAPRKKPAGAGGRGWITARPTLGHGAATSRRHICWGETEVLPVMGRRGGRRLTGYVTQVVPGPLSLGPRFPGGGRPADRTSEDTIRRSFSRFRGRRWGGFVRGEARGRGGRGTPTARRRLDKPWRPPTGVTPGVLRIHTWNGGGPGGFVFSRQFLQRRFRKWDFPAGARPSPRSNASRAQKGTSTGWG